MKAKGPWSCQRGAPSRGNGREESLSANGAAHGVAAADHHRSARYSRPARRDELSVLIRSRRLPSRAAGAGWPETKQSMAWRLFGYCCGLGNSATRGVRQNPDRPQRTSIKWGLRIGGTRICAEGWHFYQRGRARLSERAAPANQRAQAHPTHRHDITLCQLRSASSTPPFPRGRLGLRNVTPRSRRARRGAPHPRWSKCQPLA